MLSLPQTFSPPPSPSSSSSSSSRSNSGLRNQKPKVSVPNSSEMSSEEVAELAQAIHNHADVLYESWRKGQEAFNMKRMEDTLELLADPGLTPKLEHLVSTFVRRDKAKRQQFNSPEGAGGNDSQNQRRESSPIGGVNNNTRKPLPKSILAVVQRFEPQQSLSPPGPKGQEIPVLIHSSREASPATTTGDNNPARINLPGVGPVTKNVVWAETINKHNTTTERIGDRGSSPIPTPINIKTYLDSSNQATNNGITKTIISPTTGKIVRERTIPIERSNDTNDSSFNNKNNGVSLQSASTRDNRFSPGRVISTAGPTISPTYTTNALEQEEEKLLRALQVNQVVVAPKYSSNKIGSSIPPREKVLFQTKVDFAKERIRQSQEHPLTQQRLELQKRLSLPNGNLAAAIALQQGKLKFQPSRSAHSALDETDLHGHGQVHNGGGKEITNGKSFVRFGPGATVADRVQLFEKYPTHIGPPLVGHGHGSRAQSPIRTPGHVITHPIHIQHSSEPHSQLHQPPSSGSVSNDSQLPFTSQPVQTQNSCLASANNVVGNVNSNAHAPWRISPARDVRSLIISQPSESTGVVSRKSTDPIPTTVVSPVLVSSPPPPALTSKKHPKDKVPRVGTCGPPVSKSVPKFFWPEGKPTSNTVLQNTLTKAECKLKEENNCVNYDKFGELMVASGLPLYWKKPFWMALCLSPDGICTSKIFIPFLRYLLTDVPDDAAKFVRILSSASRNFPVGYDKNNYNNNNTNMNIKYYTDHGNYCQDLKFVELTMTEFVQMIQDIIDTHPGLGFLRDAPEFHSRYITTVISRIFYKVNRSWSGRLTLTEIRRSNLLGIIKRLEEETDINTITEYFSYEHFYVIYCKFWELDKDHDLLIDKHDLAAHAEHAMSSRIIERIFSGTVLRGWDVANPLMAAHDKMTYSDFVWFLLSEEDKKTPTAIEYWFRCLDVDGDGIISPYELQYFYSEQENRIESLGIEPLHFSNVYCQIVDMLHCSSTGIRLKDLKNNPYLAANVFNTVFNLEKYLEHEQRDPFAASPGNQENGEGDSDWDRYAATEYELLIAEESPGDHLHDSGLEEILMTP
ncbi:uncharacterized protein LOC110842304 isoform X1 [Folsomia candida]|uniref:uncharacterized protein LOC110842304 isoform X1 n=1 Tax=Folsomia candida TaxID=158441 RepID=UPI000B8FF42D|nr:uncharacterized protein LOC110842304 isoform X1 [Folsomia candida]